MKKYLIGGAMGILLTISSLALAQSYSMFPDVKDTDYFYEGVQLMGIRGVVKGYDDGNFGPNDSVTRGQVATMLNRYDQSFINYHGEDNTVGHLIDIVCAKTTVNESDAEYGTFVALCKSRGESQT